MWQCRKMQAFIFVNSPAGFSFAGALLHFSLLFLALLHARCARIDDVKPYDMPPSDRVANFISFEKRTDGKGSEMPTEQQGQILEPSGRADIPTLEFNPEIDLVKYLLQWLNDYQEETAEKRTAEVKSVAGIQEILTLAGIASKSRFSEEDIRALLNCLSEDLSSCKSEIGKPDNITGENAVTTSLPQRTTEECPVARVDVAISERKMARRIAFTLKFWLKSTTQKRKKEATKVTPGESPKTPDLRHDDAVTMMCSVCAALAYGWAYAQANLLGLGALVHDISPASRLVTLIEERNAIDSTTGRKCFRAINYVARILSTPSTQTEIPMRATRMVAAIANFIGVDPKGDGFEMRLKAILSAHVQRNPTKAIALSSIIFVTALLYKCFSQRVSQDEEVNRIMKEMQSTVTDVTEEFHRALNAAGSEIKNPEKNAAVQLGVGKHAVILYGFLYGVIVQLIDSKRWNEQIEKIEEVPKETQVTLPENQSIIVQ